MSCLEKKHVSRKASMRHPSNLDSYMDETDREVMSLTDRAFKSLCIGDEAIYNDSELLSSPVDCHKPLAEEISKKPRENMFLDVKKHGSNPPNGLYRTPWKTNKKQSTVSSLFAAFAAKKNNDATMTNGDSWDKSALLSIQTELLEFSSDFQNHLMDGHIHMSQCKSSDKGSANQLNQDTHKAARNSFKNQSSKLKKLNSKNFFLHSEFSPFQSWGDLNKFGLGNVENVFPCNSSSVLYNSPLYRELTNSNVTHKQESKKNQTIQNTPPLEPEHTSQPDMSQSTSQTLPSVPSIPEKHSKPHLPDVQIEPLQPLALETSSGSFQRCQSEGDLYAPWRKSRSRAKCVVQPLASSPVCERSNTVVQSVTQNKTKVRTVEESSCINSTPFNILQLLTPVIPSRQGTGTSEILQSLHSPVVLDPVALHETDTLPSPEIKREGYKSKASSLLFNIKDNRKRVKSTYSPARFKGSDVAEQHKLSPLIEQDLTRSLLKSPEITVSETTLNAQKPSEHAMKSEIADIQSSQSSGHINSNFPDDFLGLSLLQPGNRGSPINSSKSKKSPLAKVTYPSLNLYQKSNLAESSLAESNTRTMLVDAHHSYSAVNKSTEQKKSNEHFLENDSKEAQRKKNFTKPELTNANVKYTNQTHVETAGNVLSEKKDPVGLKEKDCPTVIKTHNAQQDAVTLSGIQDKLNAKQNLKPEEKPKLIQMNETHRTETKSKNLFSARQNNYIKNQRYVNKDNANGDYDDDVDDEGACEYWQEKAIYAGMDNQARRELNVDENKVQEKMDAPLIKESRNQINDAIMKHYYIKSPKNVHGASVEPGAAKNDASSMKGNTSAKIALFTLKEQPSNTVPGSKKKNIVKDKYELATVALEKRIAERELQKKESEKQDLRMKRDDKRETTLASTHKEASGCARPDMQGQNAETSDFISQNITNMSHIDPSHGQHHVTDVKLDRTYKQEESGSPSTLKDRSDRHSQNVSTGNVKSIPDATENKETENMPKNIHHVQERVVPNISDVNEESIERKKGSYKHECPKEERENSQSKDKAMNESVKTSEMNKPNRQKDERAVRDHASSRLEKFNTEPITAKLDVQESLSQSDSLMVYRRTELISPQDILGLRHNHTVRAKDSENKEIRDKDSKVAMSNDQSLNGEIDYKQEFQTENKYVLGNQEDKNDTTESVNQCASDVRSEAFNRDRSECHGENSVKEYLHDHFGKFYEPDNKCGKTPTLNLLNPDDAPTERILLYDILKHAEPSPMVDNKHLEQGNHLPKVPEDSDFLPKTEELSSLNRGEERKSGHLSTPDFCSETHLESQINNSDMTVLPDKDIEKEEWVHCLIDSAHNLTPPCHSNSSSPTMGKPALFKVKDNTFSASPVTKTVRPTLHKTIAGVTQPWSPRESLSGSERGEEDPDAFKSPVEVPSTPVQFTHSSQPLIQIVHPLTSQPTKNQERKQVTNSYTFPKEEVWQLAHSPFSDEIDSYEMSPGQDFALQPAPIEGIEKLQAASERSESTCSVIDNQLQGKPPAVPPKTEKALRRAMKLTTKRIQKAEAKGKFNRGRSSEKGSCQKHERRHQSIDKVLSDRSNQQEHSIERLSSNKNTAENINQTADKHNKPSRSKEKVSGKKLHHECPSSRTNMDGDGKGSMAEIQSQHKDQFESLNVECGRSGRATEKHVRHKVLRRAQSLDRFSSGYEQRLLRSEDPVSKTNTDTVLQNSAQTTPFQHNSIGHTYSVSMNNIVSQSFPMTQRKLLQDLDSGQYFVVDMPVQVKTKTFFDPETGSYVQLPVQSLESSVPRAQSVEVVNAPPLMLYPGFVPVPVPSLP